MAEGKDTNADFPYATGCVASVQKGKDKAEMYAPVKMENVKPTGRHRHHNDRNEDTGTVCTSGEMNDNRPDTGSFVRTSESKMCHSTHLDKDKPEKKENKNFVSEQNRSQTKPSFIGSNGNRKKDVDFCLDASEKAMDEYVFFWSDQDVYSQRHRSVFYISGVRFTCAEQYMMYKQAELFQDFNIRGQILEAKDPRRMEALVRKVSNFEERLWRSQCLYVVKEGNIAKFSQNEVMKMELFATHPRVLVEASPFDNIWGIGLDVDSPKAYDEHRWEGLNLLGFILTEVRDELMWNAGKIEENQKKVYLEGLRDKYCAQLKEYSEYLRREESDKTDVLGEVLKETVALECVPGGNTKHNTNKKNKEYAFQSKAEVHVPASIENVKPTGKARSHNAPRGQNFGKSAALNDETPDTKHVAKDEPKPHQPKTAAEDQDKPEKREIKNFTSEQERSHAKPYDTGFNIDAGCDIDTGRHGNECKERSEQPVMKRLQMNEKYKNATEGSYNGLRADASKDNQPAINAVESEQDGRSERKYNDKGYDVDTCKHGKECKENSKTAARNRLQMLEQKNNAAEGSDWDVSAYYSKDYQGAVSLKTTGMHMKCFSSSKQEKESKAKKYTYHLDEPSKSGNWNREKVHEQDEPDVYPYYEAMEKALEKYVYFWKRWDIYSQWHKSKFYVNGQKFTCAEQYMMYKKAELFEDFKLRRQILKAKDPQKMEALGKKVSNFDELLWRSQCLYVVKEGNMEKFSQNKEMEKELFDTYPRVLVEANPYDQIWGIGLDAESPKAYDESTWGGLNLLGFIITEVRDELMFKAGRIEENQKKVYLEALKTKYCEPLEQNPEYFSSVGDDKTEEREEASRSKPGSDDRHEMNNDNNEEVVHGKTKISEAEPTKKVMGAWGKSPKDKKYLKT